MNVDAILKEAVRSHQDGQLPKAEKLYRSILSRQPRNPDALHLLGTLLGQLRHFEESIRLMGLAVEVRPNDTDILKNLGRILADSCRLSDSLRVYRRVTQLTPRDPVAWYAYGICLRMAEQIEPAIAAFNKAIEIEPTYGEAYGELGNLLRRTKKFEQAIEAHQHAVRLQPNSASAFNNLGNAFKDHDQYDAAISAYMRAIELDGQQLSYVINVGNALGLKEAFPDALKAYDWVINLDPDCIDAHTGRAQALTDMRLFDLAVAANSYALKLGPENAKVLVSTAETFSEMRQTDKALHYYQEALRCGPKSTDVLKGIGTALRSIGRFGEANEYFRQALELDPGDASIYRLLATTGNEKSESEIQRLIALLNSEAVNDFDRASAGFALGKYLDDANRFDEAFARYAEANTLHRSVMAREGDRFDKTALLEEISQKIAVFQPQFFENRKSWGLQSELPVFVVGMPRSGTTLIEQILASHSQIYGAGELREITTLAAALSQGMPQPVPEHWLPGAIKSAANEHVELLKKLGGSAPRIVDKMPANILHLGLIATLFPNACVIFSRRDPRDNCLSCFFQIFRKHSLLFTYDLEDCATQFLEQERLREHWLKALPLRMLSMQYEDLVADLEGQSRRLIDFCGLEWEPACLDFHKTERSVVTASVWQVRQPLYSSSVGRWKHYEKHLGPLLAELAKRD